MPGFVCAASTGDQLNDPAGLLADMLRPLSTRSHYIESRGVTRHAVVGVMAHDREEGVAQDGPISLAVSGRIHEPAPDGSDSLAVTLLARYKRGGLDGLLDLNGYYVVTVWDEVACTLHVITDRMGFARCHYWQCGSTLYVASQFKSFIWHTEFDPSISNQGLVEYLVFGCTLEERSLFANVKRLPGGSVLTWSQDSLAVRRYWDYTFYDSEPKRPAIDYAEELVDITRRTVKRAIGRNKPIIALSGGYDARFIAAVIGDFMEYGDCEAYTMGPGSSWDVVFARDIARRLGIPFNEVGIPDSFFADYAVEGVRRTEAGVIGHTCYRIATDAYLRERAGSVVLNGVFGDFYHSYSTEMSYGPLDTYFQRNLARGNFLVVMGEPLLESMLQPHVRRETKLWMRENLQRMLDSTPAGAVRHRTDHFELHATIPHRFGRMNMDYTEAWCHSGLPFCDNENLEFAMRLPLKIRNNEQLQHLIFTRIFPEVGCAPHTETGKPMHAGKLTMAAYSAMGWLQFKAIPRLTGGRVAWRNRKTYVHYAHWLRNANRAYVEDLLDQEHLLEDHFQMDYIRNMCSDFMEGRSDDFGPIYNLAGLVLFKQHYCDRRGQFE
jgi:asparagine synthetase B (glutamine-hydrolysing)